MNIKLKKTNITEPKMTIGEKVVRIVRLGRETYLQIYKIDDSNSKAIKQLEAEYEKRVKDIINS